MHTDCYGDCDLARNISFLSSEMEKWSQIGNTWSKLALNTDFHSECDLARDIFVLFSKRENGSEMG